MPATAATTGTAFAPEQERVLSKVMWRIVPFLLLCYIFAYLDRVNVGIASLTMNKDLGISPSEFGWSAGLFFFGYFLAEVPSNLALQHFGPRKWIARILITWGLLSTATAFAVDPVSFGTGSFSLALFSVAAFLTMGAILIRVGGISLQQPKVGFADGKVRPTSNPV